MHTAEKSYPETIELTTFPSCIVGVIWIILIHLEYIAIEIMFIHLE